MKTTLTCLLALCISVAAHAEDYESCRKNQNDCKTACSWDAMGGGNSNRGAKGNDLPERMRRQMDCMQGCVDRIPCQDNEGVSKDKEEESQQKATQEE